MAKARPESEMLLVEILELQRKLRTLKVTPPPPTGKPAQPNMHRAGKYYKVTGLPARRAYAAQLRAAYAQHGNAWHPASHLHRVLAAALSAAPESERPPGPHHHGVPARPAFANPGYVAIHIYCAESLVGTLRPKERAQYDAYLAWAERFDGRGTFTKKELAELGRLVKTIPVGGSAALHAAHVAAAMAYDGDRNGNPGDVAAREQVVATMRLLLPAAIRPFLVGLDEVILREDLYATLAKVAGYEAKSPLVAALWRAASDDATTQWIGRLADKNYLLLYKLRGRYQVIVGAREDVLASVPDAHMGSALKAVE